MNLKYINLDKLVEDIRHKFQRYDVMDNDPYLDIEGWDLSFPDPQDVHEHVAMGWRVTINFTENPPWGVTFTIFGSTYDDGITMWEDLVRYMGGAIPKGTLEYMTHRAMVMVKQLLEIGDGLLYFVNEYADSDLEKHIQTEHVPNYAALYHELREATTNYLIISERRWLGTVPVTLDLLSRQTRAKRVAFDHIRGDVAKSLGWDYNSAINNYKNTEVQNG